MKNLKFGFLGLVAAGMMTFTSCTDLCKDVTCVNGTCDEETGDCLCDAGYEGTDCGTAMNAKFVGNFNATETCTTGNYSYTCTGAASSTGASAITFNGIYGVASNITATTTDGLHFTIASQPIGTVGTISGSGDMNASGTSITMTYTVVVGVDSDQCTATLVKA